MELKELKKQIGDAGLTSSRMDGDSGVIVSGCSWWNGCSESCSNGCSKACSDKCILGCNVSSSSGWSVK